MLPAVRHTCCREFTPTRSAKSQMKVTPLRLLTLIAFFFATQSARADNAVLYWNDQALDAVRLARNPPPIASAFYAAYHVAIFDAVNSITRDHQSWLNHEPAPADATMDAAIASASFTMLNAL